MSQNYFEFHLFVYWNVICQWNPADFVLGQIHYFGKILKVRLRNYWIQLKLKTDPQKIERDLQLISASKQRSCKKIIGIVTKITCAWIAWFAFDSLSFFCVRLLWFGLGAFPRLKLRWHVFLAYILSSFKLCSSQNHTHCITKSSWDGIVEINKCTCSNWKCRQHKQKVRKWMATRTTRRV